MEDINKSVAKDFDRYCQIKSKEKSLCDDKLLLHATQTHPLNQCGDFPVQFADGSETAHLNVDVNVHKTKSFRFRLMCDSFMPQPSYRFESDGGTHRNPPAEGLTLKQRQIPTPHFHRYDRKGKNFAYRTDVLDANEAELVGDYNKALQHFCQEENVGMRSGLAIEPETLPLGTCEFPDPLEGVDFK